MRLTRAFVLSLDCQINHQALQKNLLQCQRRQWKRQPQRARSLPLRAVLPTGARNEIVAGLAANEVAV